MKGAKWSWLACILAGGALGLVASAVLAPYIMDGRGPAAVTCLLCTALGATLGAAALPFADNGPALLRCSLIHLGATALEVSLLLWVSVGLRDGRAWALWMGILVLVYALIWLGRWVLLWCDVLPPVLGWIDHTVVADVPVLSGLVLPYFILPVVSFCAGLSLGKRQGLCLLYPAACFLCYLPMVFWIYNYTALFHCAMTALPALGGNVLGWLCRRRAAGQTS